MANRWFEMAKIFATLAGFFVLTSGIFFSSTIGLLQIGESRTIFASDYFLNNPNSTFAENVSLWLNQSNQPVNDKINSNNNAGWFFLGLAAFASISALLYGSKGFKMEEDKENSKNSFFLQ